MNDHPHALELIAAARDELQRILLPAARPDQQYTLRMIASALGIAERELASDASNRNNERYSLARLYGLTGDGNTPLVEQNCRLAQDIRAGRYDDAAALRTHLLLTARAKLAAAYPQGLTGDG
jgi:hypothetical protein